MVMHLGSESEMTKKSLKTESFESNKQLLKKIVPSQ